MKPECPAGAAAQVAELKRTTARHNGRVGEPHKYVNKPPSAWGKEETNKRLLTKSKKVHKQLLTKNQKFYKHLARHPMCTQAEARLAAALDYCDAPQNAQIS